MESTEESHERKDIEKIEDELDKFAQMKKQILNKYLQ